MAKRRGFCRLSKNGGVQKSAMSLGPFCLAVAVLVDPGILQRLPTNSEGPLLPILEGLGHGSESAQREGL